MYIYIHTIYIYIWICISHIYVYISLYTYIHTYLPTHIHTYIHTYIHYIYLCLRRAWDAAYWVLVFPHRDYIQIVFPHSLLRTNKAASAALVQAFAVCSFACNPCLVHLDFKVRWPRNQASALLHGLCCPSA